MGILFLGCAPTGLDFEQSQISNAPSMSESAYYDTNPLSEPMEVAHDKENVMGNAYVFGEGDTLKVTVFQEDDLSGKYKIDSEGYISIPLIGKVKAAGLTADAVIHMVEEKLSEGYLRNPDVMVEVSSYRPFSVLGEVGAPGNYSYTEGFSVADAVAVAGGFTYRANKKGFELLRREQKGWNKLEARVGDYVRPGDIIYVRERMF